MTCTSFVEWRWARNSSRISFCSHSFKAWTENTRWGLKNNGKICPNSLVPFNTSVSSKSLPMVYWWTHWTFTSWRYLEWNVGGNTSKAAQGNPPLRWALTVPNWKQGEASTNLTTCFSTGLLATGACQAENSLGGPSYEMHRWKGKPLESEFGNRFWSLVLPVTGVVAGDTWHTINPGFD